MLADADRALLDFAGRWYRHPGAHAEALTVELGLSETAYWRRINVLLDDPQALAYAPSTVLRLRRVREQRIGGQAADRGLGARSTSSKYQARSPLSRGASRPLKPESRWNASRFPARASIRAAMSAATARDQGPGAIFTRPCR